MTIPQNLIDFGAWFQNLAPPVWVLAFVLAVVVLGQLYVWYRQIMRPELDTYELAKRVNTWWVIIALVALAFWGSTKWYPAPFVLFGFISFIALKEFISMLPFRHEDRPALFVAYLFIPVQYYLASQLSMHGLFEITLVVYLLAAMVIALIVRQKTDGFVFSFGSIFAGLMIAVYSLSHLAHFFALPADANPNGGVIGLVLFVLVLTQGNDVMQYMWGKLLGRHKIIPLVSPKKTWEGFIGGAVTTAALAVFLAPLLTPFSTFGALTLGFMIAVLGFFGDVFISAIKRDLGFKDTGSILPGHGGMLDRVDSLTLVSPIYFHVVYYFIFMKGGWTCFTTSCG